MKFIDGFWQLCFGVMVLYVQEVYDIVEIDVILDGLGLVIIVFMMVIVKCGDIFNWFVLMIIFFFFVEGVICVCVVYYIGGCWYGGFIFFGVG